MRTARHFRPLAGLLACGLLLTASSAAALDKIKLTRGPTINATIQEMDPREVTVKRTGGEIEKIPVNEIESISFDAEPPQMNMARSAASGGRHEEVLRTLEKLAGDMDKFHPRVQEDIRYYQALSGARLALGGSGDVRTAGAQLRDFVQKNPSHYRLLEATEVLGDLFTALERHDLAQQQYENLERGAPWNDIKMRARVAKAYSLRAQGKSDQALAEFESALTLVGAEPTPAVVAQSQAATLGKAACLADAGNHDQAVQLVESVIAAADPEQAELHARAYNTLGACLRKGGKTKEALLAYLHVDVLYPSVPQAHAEALRNLVDLWPAAGNPQRAVQAQETLKARYPNSPWAKG